MAAVLRYAPVNLNIAETISVHIDLAQETLGFDCNSSLRKNISYSGQLA